MTKINFINSNLAKELLLFDIYDVDEFVLREVERIKNSNYLNIWDVSKARRISFEITQVNENKYEEDEISKEEYLFQKELDNNRCFTKLNYEDFEQNFPLEELDTWYGDEWLYDFHYNEAFLQSAINWIDGTDGDSSKKLRIRDLINEIKRSLFALGNIKHGWSKNIPINKIQEKAIQIFKRFDDVMLEGITSHYIEIFPELFEKTKIESNSNSSPKNPFPRIFKNGEAFILFDNLKDSLCNDDRTLLADFSFVFRIMHKEKYIYDYIQESEFRNFLSKEYQIEIDKLKTLDNCSTQKKIDLYNLVKLQSIPK